MSTVPLPSGRNVSRFAKPLLQPLGRGGLALAAWLALAPGQAGATPYASGLTNVGGTISFYLNEPADSVKVEFDAGAGGTNDLGALPSGRHSFSLGTHSSYRIRVFKSSGPGYTSGVTNRIGASGNVLTYFFVPRGVAVNRNPSSPNFGRIYVTEGLGGATTVPGARTTTDGIFVLNPDLTDALGQGNTGRTGGINFKPASQDSNTPWKLEVGDDDQLYVGDWATNQSTIWVIDPDVTSGATLLASPGATNNTTVHTTISSSPIPSGSLAAGTLVLWAIDGRWTGTGGRNTLLRWDIGSSTLPFNTAPTPLGNAGNNTVNDVYCDVDRGPDGKLYVLQNRANGTDTDSLRVFDTDGTTYLWRSLAATGNPDVLRQIRAVKIRPDGQYIALNRDDGRTWIIGLTNGIPDMTQTNLLDTFVSGNSTGRDVAFDAAGNLYVINNNQEQLRIFSPGGTTVATTGSEGTFELFRPPAVSVVATDSVAGETGPDTAAFSIYRSGDTSQPLTVSYTLSGISLNGTDYVTNVLSATIPIGATNVEVIITPVDDGEAELTESVLLTLLGGLQYDTRAPIFAQADIVDNELPLVFNLIPVRTNTYEGTPGVPLTFTIERRGDTNLDIFGLVLGFTGSATIGLDYPDLIVPFIPPGVVYTNVTIAPTDDFTYEGDETVTVQVLLGSESYVPGPNSTFNGIIRDNEYPPATVLFADDFESDSSSNYGVRFGAVNGITDYTATFGFDYGAAGIPPAPHATGGTTRGLYLQVNKNEGTAAGAAGVNVYPLLGSFSNNYALRCDMFLRFGTAGTTEHAQLGLNHSGLFTNRVTQSADANNSTVGGDGIWVGIETDGSANREYTAYTYPTPTSLPTAITNRTAASLASVFPSPPWAFLGSPGNNATSPKTWADVELSQFNGVITLKINGNVIYSFSNTTPFTSGDVMLGMNDQFDSIGSPENFVIFDNLSVVRLDFDIRHIERTGNQVTIDFATSFGTDSASYRLQASTALPGNWVTDTGAVITPTPEGLRATTTATEAVKYFRIVR